jgi:DNA-nicking Smr family endonuclease
MKRRREASPEERALFESALRDAKDLKKSAAKAARKKGSMPVAILPKKPAPPARIPAGLDGRTADRLRRGQLTPEATLDLHGLTEADAHRALVTFLRTAHVRGVRLALVVTGKGTMRNLDDEPFDLELDGSKRGVLKRMTPRWLKEPELVRFVADTRPAHIRHGGAGALYVYLRKNG